MRCHSIAGREEETRDCHRAPDRCIRRERATAARWVGKETVETKPDNPATVNVDVPAVTCSGRCPKFAERRHSRRFELGRATRIGHVGFASQRRHPGCGAAAVDPMSRRVVPDRLGDPGVGSATG